MPLDISPLGNATARLREALARHRSEPLDEQLRDGLIQRFEFTYELSHKTLRRYLQERAPSSEEVVRMSFAELIRVGTAQGLLHAEWPAWRHFRDIRTRTTHTCDADTAAAVVAEIPSFRVPVRPAAAAPGMTPRIDLSAGHRQLVLELLARLLPPSARVWVFGSRTNGRARRYSDLDLLIDAGRPLSLDEAGLLREAFEESDLPYRVDIVDWHAIGPYFRRLIAAERLPLIDAANSGPTIASPPGSNGK